MVKLGVLVADGEINNDEYIGCLFNQSETKKDAAAKRIEGFLSAVLAKKIDDDSFPNAALKKLFVQYHRRSQDFGLGGFKPEIMKVNAKKSFCSSI